MRLITITFLGLFMFFSDPSRSATEKQWTDLAENSVRKVLNDPESVQFQSESVHYEPDLKFPIMCGEVTGQTLTGLETGSSYRGFKKFVADPNTSKILVLDPLDKSGHGKRNAEFAAEWTRYCQPLDNSGQMILRETSAADGESALDASELAEAARVVRSYRPKDTFDTPPTQKRYVGRKFVLELTLRETGFNKGCSGLPRWRYDARNGTLEAETSPATVFPNDVAPAGAFPEIPTALGKADSISAVSFSCLRTSEAITKGVNSFGASVAVHTSSEQSLSLYSPDPEDGTASNRVYSWQASVQGAAARELVNALRVRITGVLGEWRPGQVVVCYQDKFDATFDLPFTRITNDCMFKTTSFRVEILDSRTNKVLDAWE